MPFEWSNLPASRLCVVSGRGTVTRGDIEAYLAATIEQGVKAYAKLVDVTDCTMTLTPDDLERVAGALVSYGWGERAGPVAMIVHSALNLDMAVLLKQRVGDRPFRIFTEVGAARTWLASYRQSYDPDALPPLPGRRGRGLRPG